MLTCVLLQPFMYYAIYNFLGIIIEGNNFLGIIIEGNN